jgi:hypothetical protein
MVSKYSLVTTGLYDFNIGCVNTSDVVMNSKVFVTLHFMALFDFVMLKYGTSSSEQNYSTLAEYKSSSQVILNSSSRAFTGIRL